MQSFAFSCLVACLLLVSGRARAQDDIQLLPTPGSGPPPVAGEIEIRGMHCTPDVKEVETRRAIPISCTVDYPVEGVELRYRTDAGGKKWEKIELSQGDSGYSGTIPCSVTAKKGKLRLYLFARNENNKVVARIGRNETPLVVRLVEQSNATPPALPGQEAPQRCYEQNECPPELRGTPSCPGTHAEKNVKKGWGGSCTASTECQKGMECVKGSCETPAKCEEAKDCPEGGECTDGVCHVPDQEELKERMGPPKHHWVGLHAGPDFLTVSEATGVCGNTTEDSKKYSCFEGGNEYKGTPNQAFSGTQKSSIALATIRVLLTYEYFAGRIGAGARIGWAFRGAPKGFSPVHIEGRFLYSIRKDPFNLGFRPYLGLSLGHAQVDSSGAVSIVDCHAADSPTNSECVGATDKNKINGFLADPQVANQRQLNAYRSGNGFFFGPSLMLMFALSNEAAIVFNLNALLPAVAFEPTIGYQMGL